jgi:methyl-accepting chemotaxis protein
MALFRMKMSGKVYALLGLSFAFMFGIALFQLTELKSALEEQKKVELRHLGEIALGIASEEQAAAQRGEVTDEQAKMRAAARIGTLRYGGDEYFWINDLEPRMIMHPIKPELNGTNISGIKDPDGKNLFVEAVAVVKRDGSGFVEYQWPKPGAAEPQPKLSFVGGFKPWGWIIGTGVYVDDLRAQVWSNARRTVAIGSVAILVLAVVSMLVTRRMSTALRGMTSAMRALAAGDFDVVLPGLGRQDEIGDVAAAVETFKAKAVEKARLAADDILQRQQRAGDDERHRQERELQEKVAAERTKAAEEQAQAMRLLASALESLSAGDLTYRLDEDISETYRQIKDNFNAAIARLQETMISIVSSSREARARRPRYRMAPRIFRSVPRCRRRAWNRPRPRWRKSPPR